MKTYLYLAFISIGGLLLGCTSTHSLGKEVGSQRYTDSRLAPDCFKIGFRTIEPISFEEMRGFALKRASEVTTNHGYRYFIVESEKDLRFKRFSPIGREVAFGELVETFKGGSYDSHAPGLELLIRCYYDQPNEEAIDAYRFLTSQFSSG